MSVANTTFPANEFKVVLRPGPLTLGVIAQAAAAMARADGRAEATERQAFLAFLRRHGLLRHFGRRASLAVYDAAIRTDANLPAVLNSVGRHRDRPAARLITIAAACVAAADGAAHPAEDDLLVRLTARLGSFIQAPERHFV